MSSLSTKQSRARTRKGNMNLVFAEKSEEGSAQVAVAHVGRGFFFRTVYAFVEKTPFLVKKFDTHQESFEYSKINARSRLCKFQ